MIVKFRKDPLVLLTLVGSGRSSQSCTERSFKVQFRNLAAYFKRMMVHPSQFCGSSQNEKIQPKETKTTN
jgi:hypothetical protein